ncbi:hypothetical protein D3C81_758520 [compost metagenome]
MELDLGRVGVGEGLHFRVVRVVPGLGPVAPVGAQAMLHGLGLQHLKAAMVLQGLATGFAEAVEILAQRVVALAEALVQGFEQAQAGAGGTRPVNQRALLQVFQLLLQAAGFDGHAHLPFAQQGGGAGVQGVEQQAAGGRVGAVVLLVDGRQGVDRADGQGIGTALGGRAGQLFQGQAVAVAAIAGAAQAVQLHRQAPAARWRLLHAVFKAVAAWRGHGHGEAAAVDFHLVVADGQRTGQAGLVVEAEGEGGVVLQGAVRDAGGAEVARQCQWLAEVGGQQRRQVLTVFGSAHGAQAGGNGGVIAGRVAKAFKDVAQYLVADTLGPGIGVDPVAAQPDAGCQAVQGGFAHGRSWAGGSRLTTQL